jgi:thiosulfate dehydrogenase
MVTPWPARSDAKAGDQVVPFHAPDERTIPEGPVGDAIRYGKKVLTETQKYAKPYIGNGLNCSSCHLEAGRKAWASPWVGIWGVFPEYRSRSGKINALQDRINDCFERSMNGTALPYDGDEMRGILAYIWWLSRDVPTGAVVRGRGSPAYRSPGQPIRSAARRSIRRNVPCAPVSMAKGKRKPLRPAVVQHWGRDGAPEQRGGLRQDQHALGARQHAEHCR